MIYVAIRKQTAGTRLKHLPLTHAERQLHGFKHQVFY